MLVFNWGGLAVLALAIAAWVVPQLVGEDALRLIAGFATMTVAGVALELQPRANWKPRYFWIVPDDSDSNLAPTTACAYDRIVTTVGTKAEFTGDWGVDRAFTDKAVSDHWPVWAEFVTREHGAEQ